MNLIRRYSWFGILIVSIGALSLSLVFAKNAQQSTQQLTVKTESLRNNTAVIEGDLGYPLGTSLEIEATVVDETNDLFTEPVPTGSYLLRVDKVNGYNIKHPPSFRFNVRSSSEASLAGDWAKLEELLSDLQKPNNIMGSKVLSSADVEAFKRDYVGSRHKLAVYEAARFDGVPAKLPAGCRAWTGRTFGLETYLMVLAERRP